MDNFDKASDLPGSIPVAAPFVAAYLIKIVETDAKCLLLKRNVEPYKNIWQPVTGRIEAGEKAWQAALREIKEETGLTPDRFYSANFIEQFYDIKRDIVALAPAFVGYIDTESKIKLSNEHKEFRWVSFSEACEMVEFAPQANALKHIQICFVESKPNEFLRI